MPGIISVGNITMGGTGKTPFTIYLASHYINNGNKVAILSRGYKGKLGTDTHVISDGKEIFYTPPEAADEPYMMARALPQAVVITGKKRILSYEIARETYGCNMFILDDGFQHKMRRDVNILLLDHKNPISTGFIFPFGMLREMPRAIKRADIILFTRASDTVMNPKVAKYCEGKPVFYSRHVYDHFCTIDGKLPLSAINGLKAWLLSGIAGPSQFEAQLKDLGCGIEGHSRFADHHAYTASEIAAVVESAAKAGAQLLITTEKDYVRIPKQFQCAFTYPSLTISLLNSGLFEEIDKITVK